MSDQSETISTTQASDYPGVTYDGLIEEILKSIESKRPCKQTGDITAKDFAAILAARWGRKISYNLADYYLRKEVDDGYLSTLTVLNPDTMQRERIYRKKAGVGLRP